MPLVLRRFSRPLVGTGVALVVSLVLVACGVGAGPVAALPRATVVPLTTPTIFAVIDVTPAAKELPGQSADGAAFKPIPAAIDTTSVILEPEADLVRDAWRQYLEDAHVMSADGSIDWTTCADGTAVFTDQQRHSQAGKWSILRTPRSFQWYQAVLGTYGNDGSTMLVVLSMSDDGLPNLIVTDWQDPPRRASPQNNDLKPITVTVLGNNSACSAS